jgi:hypothetical protein
MKNIIIRLAEIAILRISLSNRNHSVAFAVPAVQKSFHQKVAKPYLTRTTNK